MQQRSSLTQQQRKMGGSYRSSINQSSNASISPTLISSGTTNQRAVAIPPTSDTRRQSNNSVVMGRVITDESGNKSKVVPVSMSRSGNEGGVSDAALVYTKYALNTIIASLNSNRGKDDDGSKDFTVRDLSTCLGAWDLSVRMNSKRPSFTEKPTLDSNDETDASTAFNFYYERSCPILLNAHRPSGAMPFSVDDFGSGGIDEPHDDELPDVVGAVVLTYGADSKFTGGVGEEGVLTKAIIEFFCDPRIMLSGTVWEGEEASIAIMMQAEKRMFMQTNTNVDKSTLAMAAIAALSPSAKTGSRPMASSDDGVYIPSIWSGNTQREYKYCLLSPSGVKGEEARSNCLYVAIEDKNNLCAGDKGPAKGVCRITLTLSSESVQAKKKLMADEDGKYYDHKTSSAVHRNIRDNIRLLRPPKLTSMSNAADSFDVDERPHKRARRNALRRTSISKLIDPTLIAIGVRCKHELLLDDEEVGKVYVNGILVADCNLVGQNSVHNRTPNADVLPAHLLFGVDFTLPLFNELPSKTMLEKEYGYLLMDALITPHPKTDVVGKVLNRLITGKTEDNDAADNDTSNQNEIKFDSPSSPCLESIVLSASTVDPVGIGAKSIGTKFRMQYGSETYPCEVGTDEELRLHKLIGAQKVAKLVPTRARKILRRGGYLGLDQMAAFIWKSSGSSWDGDHNDSVRATKAIEASLQLLKKAGCENLAPNNICFVSRKQLGPAGDVSKLRSWFDSKTGVYYISDAVLFQDEVITNSNESSHEADDVKGDREGVRKETVGLDNPEELEKSLEGKEEKLPPIERTTQVSNLKSCEENENSGTKPTPLTAEDVAYLLAFYIAKEHPDAMMLEKFIRSSKLSNND